MTYDVYVTDYGVVKLTERVERYMRGIDPDWHVIVTSKRMRGKRAEFVRKKWQEVESAIKNCAAIAWSCDDYLTEF